MSDDERCPTLEHHSTIERYLTIDRAALASGVYERGVATFPADGAATCERH